MFYLDGWWPLIAAGALLFLTAAVSGRRWVLAVAIFFSPVIYVGLVLGWWGDGVDSAFLINMLIEIGALVLCVELGLGLNWLVRRARGPAAGSS